MANRKTTSIDELYSYGRTHPYGRTRDEHSQQRIRHEPSEYHRHEEVQQPQAPEDQQDHAAGYHNDVSDGWLRGSDGDGMKPTFDKGHSYRRPNKGDNWKSGTDYFKAKLRGSK